MVLLHVVVARTGILVHLLVLGPVLTGLMVPLLRRVAGVALDISGGSARLLTPAGHGLHPLPQGLQVRAEELTLTGKLPALESGLPGNDLKGLDPCRERREVGPEPPLHVLHPEVHVLDGAVKLAQQATLRVAQAVHVVGGVLGAARTTSQTSIDAEGAHTVRFAPAVAKQIANWRCG